MPHPMMPPVLALVLWTFVLWFWMYATRLPAMRKAGIDSRKLKRKDELDVLPVPVKQIADNYNHLHEQPTLFYALAFYSELMGTADAVNTNLAWAYVAARVAHSLIQCTVNFVPARFVAFATGTFLLMAIGIRNLLDLL